MQVKATCGICQGNCKVVLTLEDGKIIKVEPDRESPRGRSCFRGVHAPDILYGEQRLKKPLIRVGEKGEGKFREASWEEALDFAAQNSRQYSRPTVPRHLLPTLDAVFCAFRSPVWVLLPRPHSLLTLAPQMICVPLPSATSLPAQLPQSLFLACTPTRWCRMWNTAIISLPGKELLYR